MSDAAAGQAGSAGQMEAQSGVRLQRVILDRPAPLRDLYWRVRGDAHLQADGTLRIEPGASVAFDTNFNALFEHHWRLHTRAASFTLQIEIAGRAKLRLWRMTQHGGQTLLHEAEVDGAAEIHLPHDAPNFRQAGMVWFELAAAAGPAVLRRAEWFAADAAPEPVGLAVAICTFNREADVAGVLSAIAADPALCCLEGFAQPPMHHSSRGCRPPTSKDQLTLTADGVL